MALNRKAVKEGLLKNWVRTLQTLVLSGRFGPPQQIACRAVPGPRAGALEILAVSSAGDLLGAFTKNSCADLASTVSWQFEGKISCYTRGKLVRVDAPWPEPLSESDVPLSSISTKSSTANRWISGRDETGRTVAQGFDDASHWLVAGMTGSGKTVALTSAVAQLAKYSEGATNFVLIDGKQGEGLAKLSNIPNLIAPLAYDEETARKALAWTLCEMKQRYEKKMALGADDSADQYIESLTRLVVVIDEVQTLTTDDKVVAMLSQLLAQGRAAKVNLILSTQHPVNAVFGSNLIKANVDGRIALRVTSPDASRVVLGQSEPNAQNLLGKGDAFVMAHGKYFRTQIAYMTKAEISQLNGQGPRMDMWPDENQEKVGLALETDPIVISQSIISASRNEGRPALQRRLETVDRSVGGTSRANQIMQRGREILRLLRDSGYDLTDRPEKETSGGGFIG